MTSTRRESVHTGVAIHHSNSNSSMPQVLADIYCGSSHRNMSRRMQISRFKLFDMELDINEWPRQSNAHCWHCRLTFDTVPCSIPYNYNRVNNVFSMKGIFCSWSCAKRFCLDQKEYHSSAMVSNMRLLAIAHFHHPAMEPIVAAPPYQSLQLFGGPLSVEEFRAHQRACTKVSLLDLPFYNFPLAISTAQQQQHQAQGVNIRGLRRPTNQVETTASTPNTSQQSMYTEFLKQHSSSKKRKKPRPIHTPQPPKKRSGSLAKFVKNKKKRK